MDALEAHYDALKNIVLGLSFSTCEEYLFGTYQAEVVDAVERADTFGVDRRGALTRGLELINLLISLAERDQVPLSDEFGEIVRECEAAGLQVSHPPGLASSKPLSSFPTEPPTIHTVFVDESGTPAFEEKNQPVLSLVGIVVADEAIARFDAAVAQLLSSYGLPVATELHANDCIRGTGPFAALPDADFRYRLLRDFVALGMSHALGVHYLSMLKPMVADDFRERLTKSKLDAYTSLVLWFNLTLSVGILNAIAIRKYRYVFDRQDKYGTFVRRIIRALKIEENHKLRLSLLDGDPTEVDSASHRFVQLADVVGYFLTRYRQFEVPAFTPAANLQKYEPQVREICAIVKPKVLSFVKDGLHRLVDWQALQTWSMPAGAPGTGAPQRPKGSR